MVCRRYVPALAFIFACASRLVAQQPVFVFSTDTRDVVPVDELKGSPNIDIRPNTAREINLFVFNSADDDHELRVQFLDAKGKDVAATDIKRARRKSYTRVRFTKPMPPFPAGGTATPAAPPAPTASASPPGMELIPIRSAVSEMVGFELRLIDDEAKINKSQTVVVNILDPAKYIQLVGRPKYLNRAGESLLELTLKAADNFTGPPCVIELVFPAQPNLNTAALGAGVYRKSITEAGQSVTLYTSNLPLRTGDDLTNETFYLHVDGVSRVYTFRSNLRLEKQNLTDIVGPVDPAIRLVEDGRKEPPTAFLSQPRERYHVRVEVDHSSSPFEITWSRLNGQPEGKITRRAARHEQVWVDPAAEDGALRVTARVADWVVPLDTRDMRGQFTMTARLINANVNVRGDDRPVSFTRSLILDDTPPPIDRIRIEGLPKRQFRG